MKQAHGKEDTPVVQVRDLTELTLEERWSAVKVLMEGAMGVELIEQLAAAKYRPRSCGAATATGIGTGGY